MSLTMIIELIIYSYEEGTRVVPFFNVNYEEH